MAEPVGDRPADNAAYVERLLAYLESRPGSYGSAIAPLDDGGTVTRVPTSIARPTASARSTLRIPTATSRSRTGSGCAGGDWTPPYFDAGGREIWMITRSVPARDAEGVSRVRDLRLLSKSELNVASATVEPEAGHLGPGCRGHPFRHHQVQPVA